MATVDVTFNVAEPFGAIVIVGGIEEPERRFDVRPMARIVCSSGTADAYGTVLRVVDGPLTVPDALVDCTAEASDATPLLSADLLRWLPPRGAPSHLASIVDPRLQGLVRRGSEPATPAQPYRGARGLVLDAGAYTVSAGQIESRFYVAEGFVSYPPGIPTLSL